MDIWSRKKGKNFRQKKNGFYHREYGFPELRILGYRPPRAPDRPWAFQRGIPPLVVYRGTPGPDPPNPGFGQNPVFSGLEAIFVVFPTFPFWRPFSSFPGNFQTKSCLFAAEKYKYYPLRRSNNFWKNLTARHCFSVLWFVFCAELLVKTFHRTNENFHIFELGF